MDNQNPGTSGLRIFSSYTYDGFEYVVNSIKGNTMYVLHIYTYYIII